MKHQKGLVTIPLDEVPGHEVLAAPHPSPGAAIAKVTMASGVADRLITAIAVGVYSPDECLPSEREMARSLDVSRVTVREALKQVARLGLIRSRRGRGGGTFVTSASPEQLASETVRRTLEVELPRLRDLFDFRCMVEGMIARAAAERRTADDIAELGAALDEFRGATEMEQARRLDRRLHGLICAAARNPHLSSLSAQLTVTATLGFGAEPYLAEFFDQAVAEHEELVGHVVRGDAHAANTTAQAHFALTLQTMRIRLAGSGPRDGGQATA